MTRTPVIALPRTLVRFLVLLGTPGALLAADGGRRDLGISPYDFATRNDLLLSHLVAPSLAGEVDEWAEPLLGGLPGQVGDWAKSYFDAKRLASVMIEAFPIEGQPAVRAVDELVADCARTLGVDEPAIHIRNSPLTRTYAVKAGGRYHLVLTSGLLDLFGGRTEELKFVIGRELGHVKCGHTELKAKVYALVSAVQAIPASVIPDRYLNMLPLLALGRLFTWSREVEVSADRAGLLCCGAAKSAYQAIMRLQHGLRADSRWIDPETPDFDPGAVIRSFQEWQYEPFVKFVLYLEKQPLDHLYYQERLAELKTWVDSGAYDALLERRAGEPADQLLEIVRIVAYELAPAGQTIDPYVLVSDGDRQVLRTRTVSGVRDAEWKGFQSTDAGSTNPGRSGTGSRSSSRSGTTITGVTRSSEGS
jgi:Zn-dependent protease with chaperone function